MASIAPDSFESVARQTQLVLKALLAGQLPPGIAQEARGLLELEMMAIAAAGKRDNPNIGNEGMNVTLNLLNALDTQQLPALEPKYTHTIEVTDDVEDLT